MLGHRVNAAIFGSMPCVHIIRDQMRYSSFHLPSDDIIYALLPITIDTEELGLGLGLMASGKYPCSGRDVL